MVVREQEQDVRLVGRRQADDGSKQQEEPGVSFHDIFVNQQAKRSTPFPVLRLNHKKEAPTSGAS
jgi:hypothetical protein